MPLIHHRPHWRRLLLALLLVAPGPLSAAAPLKLQIEVADRTARDNIEASLSVLSALKAGEEDLDLLLRLHARAEGEIRKAMQALGYYEPEIDIRLQRERKPPLAIYRVAPGPRTTIGEVDLKIDGEGRDEPNLRALIDGLAPRVGEPLHHGRYEDFKQALLQRAGELGYLDARWVRRMMRVDTDRRRARLQLYFDTGRRYRIGPVRIVQNVLAPDVVARYVDVSEGQVFSAAALVQTRFRLADLGYFERVQLDADKSAAVDGAIPVTYTLWPLPSQRYRIGAGYGTDTGARVSLGAEYRYLNDAGHRLNTELRLSAVKQELGATYRIPLGRRISENLALQASSLSERIADLDTRRLAVEVALTRQPGQWQRRLYLRHEREDFSGADSGSSKLSLPGLSLDRTELDDAVRARQGWAVFADVHGAVRGLASDTGFVQGRVVGRTVLPLFEASRLLLRAEYGATLLDELSDLPPSQRFFAGGDQSVRGYAYQSIGPSNANGETIGGAYLSTYSAELEVPLRGSWGAAVFADAGGVADDPNPALRVGVGAGLRYLSPVGAIRLDLAHPLNGDGSGVRLHLGIRVGL